MRVRKLITLLILSAFFCFASFGFTSDESTDLEAIANAKAQEVMNLVQEIQKYAAENPESDIFNDPIAAANQEKLTQLSLECQNYLESLVDQDAVKKDRVKWISENLNGCTDGDEIDYSLCDEGTIVDEKELINLILAHKDYCTEKILGERIYLNVEKIISIPNRAYLRLDEDGSLVKLPELHFDEKGCYISML